MGTWGTGLFSDDVALDVRDAYERHIESGASGTEATDRVLADLSEAIKDPDDGPVIWLALAAAQEKLGRLEERVRDRALNVIRTGADLRRWESPARRRQRKAILARLEARLISPEMTPRTPSRRASKPKAEVVEGGWYAVPLPSGGYALCVVTFFDGGHFVGFYFGPRVSEPVEFVQRDEVAPEGAVLFDLTAAFGITTGRWPAVGRRTRDVEDWELPEFVRDEGSTDEYLVRLEPRKYSWYVARRRRPKDDPDRRRGYFGFSPPGAIESVLDHRMVDEMPSE